MYDLDKTQEWLNRTMQMSRPPAIRGGVQAEPNARRNTALSTAAAFVIIAGVMLLFSSTSVRPGLDSGDAVVHMESQERIAEAPPLREPSFSIAAQSPAPASLRRHSRPARIIFGRSAASLDGDIVPLPGHAAPPAPLWLDSAIRIPRQ